MYTALSDENESLLHPHRTKYSYDQLNRLVAMNGMYANQGTSSGYSSSYSYDANGNLQTLGRYASNGSTSVKMDDFVYNYNNGTNKLNWVDDQAGASQFGNADIDNSMNSGNYQYDLIGQLTRDTDEGITNISWTVTNKVEDVSYSSGKQIHFDYNAMGNRIAKHVTVSGITESTYYTLDAQGNQMGIYTFASNKNKLYLSERDIYGSKRLGQEQLNKQMVLNPTVNGTST